MAFEVFLDMPKKANLECKDSKHFKEGFHTNLDLEEYIPRGNLTFSWNFGAYESSTQIICSPQYFLIKELARRMKMNAYPVLVHENETLSLPGSNDIGSAFMKAVYERRIDIFTEETPITDMIASFVKTTNLFKMQPALVILGTKYPPLVSNGWFSLMKVYGTSVWISLFICILILSSLTSLVIKMFDKQNRNLFRQNRHFSDIWFQELRRFIKAFMQSSSSSGVSFLPISYHLIYSVTFLPFLLFLIIFSSLLTSQTINVSYSLIDSLTDLIYDHPEIEPIFSLDELDVKHLMEIGYEDEKMITTRALSNGLRMNGSLLEMMDKSNNISKMVKAQSHVFMSIWDQNLIISGKVTGKLDSSFHVAREAILLRPDGLVYHKNLDVKLAKAFEKIVNDMFETGIYDKQAMEEMAFCYYTINLFVMKRDKSNADMNQIKDKTVLTLDGTKLAFGPFGIGFILALLAFTFEI